MKRVNKTEKNLQKIWDDLDNACGLLDNSFTNLSSMSGLPKGLEKSIDAIDFSAIVGLKNEVEELLEQIKSK